jgi:hypothetical protein
MKYDKALGIAISQYLSDWDNTLTNDEILSAVWDEDFDKVTFWEPFEHYEGQALSDIVEDLANSIYTSSKSDAEADPYVGKLLKGILQPA